MPNYVADKLLILERLKRHTTVINGHWIYHGAKQASGHGRIKINGRKFTTSRLFLSIHLGLDYDNWEWQANHKDSECRERSCWNPAHLYAGTHKDNVRDSVKFKTHKESRKTHCPQGHVLDGLRGNNVRYCLTCNRERVKQYAKLR